MAQSIKNLILGSKIKCRNGITYTLVAKNHYGKEEVTLRADISQFKQINMNTGRVDYSTSDINYWLNNTFPKSIDADLNKFVTVTRVPYMDVHSEVSESLAFVNAKFFLPSIAELGLPTYGVPDFNTGYIKPMPYFNSNATRRHSSTYWTRSEYKFVTTQNMFIAMQSDGSKANPVTPNSSNAILPFFNVSGDLLVSDDVTDGNYGFVFNKPPVLYTIGNMQGNFGSPTTIEYIATDADDPVLKHYFSRDNGTTWVEIEPSRVGDKYTTQQLFNHLGNHSCRVKVVDSDNNEVVSNLFLVTLNSSAPTVNIIAVSGKVISYKVNCTTNPIAKVEILLNGVVKQTVSTGFDTTLKYEVNSSDLQVGSNAIQIRVTSSTNLVGTRSLEVNKKTYNLPPVGAKVIISGQEYSITAANQNGANQTYTLDKNLMSNVFVGSTIQVLQDYVNVQCSLSNVVAEKHFRDMKLVKTKVLKGAFSGYIEEKYELEGEGRYSTMKLELQRFNNGVASEVIELQQAFDYLED